MMMMMKLAGWRAEKTAVLSMAQFTDTDMPVDLVLIRHGESEGNLSDDLGKKGKKLGKSEMAEQLQSKIHGIHTSEWRLTDLGRHQAGRAGELVRREILGQNGGAGVVGAFDTGFCSSYARAMETAACLAIPNTKCASRWKRRRNLSRHDGYSLMPFSRDRDGGETNPLAPTR
jgi:hypothetical protein